METQILRILEDVLFISAVILTAKLIYRLLDDNKSTYTAPTLRRSKRQPKVVKTTDERDAELEEKNSIKKGWD